MYAQAEGNYLLLWKVEKRIAEVPIRQKFRKCYFHFC
jgi:hypothetical protein